MKLNLPVSLDVLLLFVLVPAQIARDGLDFLLVIPLFLYVLLEIWNPISTYRSLPDKLDKTRISFLIRFFLLLIMIAAATIVPAVQSIGDRYQLSQQEPVPAAAYQNTHDGAVQVEAALDFLSDGKNPYVERYDQTPIRHYGFVIDDIPHNPALDYFVYLPGYLVISYPLHAIFDVTDVTYDQRVIYLVAYVLVILVLPLLVKAPAMKLLILAAVGLNPQLTGPVIYGMNDVLVLLLIIFLILLLQRKRLLGAAIILGLTCTIKQSAWFLVPFFVLYLIPRTSSDRPYWETLKYLVASAFVIILIIAPFALWDFSAFVTDVFAFPAGNVSVNYPIVGYTIGTLMIGAGLIKSRLDSFPFWIPQLLVGIPLLLFLAKYQWRRNDLDSMLLAAGFFTLGLGIVSRFFQWNYVGYIAVLITMGIILGYDMLMNDRRYDESESAEGLLAFANEEE